MHIRFDGPSTIKRDETMKTVIAALASSFVLMVILSGATPVYGTDESRTSLQAFGDNCTSAILNREGANGLSYFQTLHINGNEKYPVKEYKVKTGHPDTQKIVVWIGKGTDRKVEIPRITDICLDGKADPDVGTDPGDIIFYSQTGHSVEILFHLNGLKSTGWKVPKVKKTKASDSIWMVACQGTCDDDLHPTRKDWPPPPCATPKEQNVKVGRYDMSFTMCSNSGGVDNDYVYEVHMDQVGSGSIGVDVSIDPKIINHQS
jgi:hypothetical protein